MKLKEYYSRPKLIALHYFNMSLVDYDSVLIDKFGLKIDKNNKPYLPQYNTSGNVFDRNFTSLLNMYGRPQTKRIN